MVELSLIIPVYNEEDNIQPLYERLKKVITELELSHELIFINDGSSDRSLSLVKALSSKDSALKFIDFSRNFGHQIAVSAGLDVCTGKAAVIIDSDMQDPPELIKELYAAYEEGFEVVYAQRKSRKGESYFKRSTAKVFYKMLARMTAIKIPVDTGDFRIIDRRVIDILKEMPESNKYLRGQIAWVGFNQKAVMFEREERAAGETGYTFRKMISLAIDGITGFSNFPLKLTTIAGFVVSIVAFLFMFIALYARLISHEYVPGWASLILSVLFIGGIQLIGIGIIGEYVGRINADVRKRPLYIVRESNVETEEKQ